MLLGGFFSGSSLWDLTCSVSVLSGSSWSFSFEASGLLSAALKDVLLLRFGSTHWLFLIFMASLGSSKRFLPTHLSRLSFSILVLLHGTSTQY